MGNGQTAVYDPATYPENIEYARTFSAMLAALPLRDMLSQAERSDTIGPLIHTTEYRAAMDGLRLDIELLKSLTHVAAVVKRMEAFLAEKRAKAAPATAAEAGR